MTVSPYLTWISSPAGYASNALIAAKQTWKSIPEGYIKNPKSDQPKSGQQVYEWLAGWRVRKSSRNRRKAALVSRRRHTAPTAQEAAGSFSG